MDRVQYATALKILDEYGMLTQEQRSKLASGDLSDIVRILRGTDLTDIQAKVEEKCKAMGLTPSACSEVGIQVIKMIKELIGGDAESEES